MLMYMCIVRNAASGKNGLRGLLVITFVPSFKLSIVAQSSGSRHSEFESSDQVLSQSEFSSVALLS